MIEEPDHDATEEEIAADAARRTEADEHVKSTSKPVGYRTNMAVCAILMILN